MPYENVTAVSMTATGGADIAARRFLAMGAGTVAQAADGVDTVGVSLEAYDDSEHALGNASNVIPVAARRTGSKVEVEAGAAVAAGADVASDSVGRAKTSATADLVQGKALTAAGAAGEIITVMFAPKAEPTA